MFGFLKRTDVAGRILSISRATEEFIKEHLDDYCDEGKGDDIREVIEIQKMLNILADDILTNKRLNQHD